MSVTRRELMANSGKLAFGFATGTMAASATQAEGESSAARLKIVVCGGHPGDPEYGCGGTIARLTALGHDITLLYLNNGAWETSAEIRIAEAKRACEILKAHPSFAGQANGHAIVD